MRARIWDSTHLSQRCAASILRPIMQLGDLQPELCELAAIRSRLCWEMCEQRGSQALGSAAKVFRLHHLAVVFIKFVSTSFFSLPVLASRLQSARSGLRGT